jgi:hypothetical protein
MLPLPPLLIQPPPLAPLPMQRRLQLPLQQHRSRNSFALIHMPARTAYLVRPSGCVFLRLKEGAFIAR